MEVKQKCVKTIRPKLKLFCASEPEKSVLMWGVNYCISQLSHISQKPVLLTDDFKACMKVAVRNQLYIKDHMPVRYSFKEYCPMVFQDLRRRFDITNDMLLQSFTEHQPLRRTRKSGNQKTSPRKSSLMLTHDKRFAAISISNEQRDVILTLLEEYHAYVVSWQGYTRLPKWVALYRIKLGDKESHILVVTNLFYPPGSVDWKFSFNLYNDSADSEGQDSVKKYSSFLKEDCLAELQHKIRLTEEEKTELWEVMHRDVEFLQSHHISHVHVLLGVKGLSTNSSSLDSLDTQSKSRRLSSATEDEARSEVDDEEIEVADLEDAKQDVPDAGLKRTQQELHSPALVQDTAPLQDKSNLSISTNSSGAFQYYIGLHFSLKRRHMSVPRKKSLGLQHHLRAPRHQGGSTNNNVVPNTTSPSSVVPNPSTPFSGDSKSSNLLQKFFMKYVI